jgi:hypothetical protein
MLETVRPGAELEFPCVAAVDETVRPGGVTTPRPTAAEGAVALLPRLWKELAWRLRPGARDAAGVFTATVALATPLVW